MKKVKVLKKMIGVVLVKERIPMNPTEIKTQVDKVCKTLGISRKDFRRALGPVIKSVMRKAEKVYLKG